MGSHAFAGFLGIDLKSPPDRLPPGKLRRAFGVDFSREVGTISIRRGQSKINSTAFGTFDPTMAYTTTADERHLTLPTWRFTTLSSGSTYGCTQLWEVDHIDGNTLRAGQVIGMWDFEQDSHGATNLPSSASVHGLIRAQSLRYARVGTSLYKDGVSFWTSFSANRSQMLAYRPLAETVIWVFIADTTLMARTDGTSVFAWGITAPATGPTIAAGSSTGLTGNFRARYTYIRKDSAGAVLAESNPSPAPSSAVTLANQDLSITAIVPSRDPQVTHTRIYRTLAGGTDYLFDKDIDVSLASTTSTQADNLLGAILVTDNNPPPATSLCAIHNEYAFLDGDTSNPGYLWFSKRWKPQNVPATNFLEMNSNDPGRALVEWNGMLLRFTRDTKYRILGSDPTTFFPVESPSRRGILLGKAWTVSQFGVWYVANDGVFLTSGILDVKMSDDIDPIFEGRTVDNNPPINKAGNHVCEFYRGKLHIAYASGSSTEPDYLATYNIETKGWKIEPLTISALNFELDTDFLTRGGADGFVYQMEKESTDDAGSNISIDVLTGDVAGESGVGTWKRFAQVNCDLNSGGETVTLSFLLDGISAESKSLSASSRSLLRKKLAAGGMVGQRGAINLTYAGQQDVRVSGIAVLYDQLAA